MLVLHAAAPELSVAVEAPPSSMVSTVEPESDPVVDVEPSAPLSQEDVIAALRGSPPEERGARPSSGSDDKGALLSFANHVAISTKTPADLDDEISSLERATAEARVAQWKKMSESAQVRRAARPPEPRHPCPVCAHHRGRGRRRRRRRAGGTRGADRRSGMQRRQRRERRQRRRGRGRGRRRLVTLRAWT